MMTHGFVVMRWISATRFFATWPSRYSSRYFTIHLLELPELPAQRAGSIPPEVYMSGGLLLHSFYSERNQHAQLHIHQSVRRACIPNTHFLRCRRNPLCPFAYHRIQTTKRLFPESRDT